MARRHFCRLRTAATRLQALWRGRAARKDFVRLKAAAVVCQTQRRLRLAAPPRPVPSLVRFKASVGALQNRWRGIYLHRSASATVVQAQWRGAVQREGYRSLREATRRAQAMWRSRVAQREYLQARARLVFIQRMYRQKLKLRVGVNKLFPFKKLRSIIIHHFFFLFG